MKQTSCVRKNVPGCYVYNECRIYPLYVTRIIRIVNFWLKMLSLDEFALLRKINDISLELNKVEDTRPASFWVQNVKKILYINLNLVMPGKTRIMSMILFLCTNLKKL